MTTAPRARVAQVPLAIVMNDGAGAGDKSEARSTIEKILTEAGREFEFVPAGERRAFDALCDRSAAAIARRGGMLVAAGGDGTVNGVANAARKHRVPMAVIPLGTFNYFARLHAIPQDAGEAARLLLDGQLQSVSTGEVNGRLFLNNASFGLYTKLIHQRERAKARFGRLRIVAALSAASALLQGQRPFAIRIVDQDTSDAVQYTSMVFVACNAFQLEALGLDAVACSHAGALGVVLLRPTGLRDRVRLLLRTALKELDEDHRLQSFCATDFDVQVRRGTIELVVDGEVRVMRTPLAFRMVADALQLVVPPPSAPAAAPTGSI